MSDFVPPQWLPRVQSEFEIAHSARTGTALRVMRCDTAPADERPAGVFKCLAPGCRHVVCKLHNCARAEHKACPECGQRIV